MKNYSEKEVTIVATAATDRIIDDTGRILQEGPGGPLEFVAPTFAAEDISFDVLSSSAEVDILVSGNSEVGKVSKAAPVIPVDLGAINTPYVFISTILDDISLTNISAYTGSIFLDIQGFVRNGDAFGQKKQWVPSKELLNLPIYVKATTEELTWLDPEIADHLRKKCVLLVTNGSSGNTLYVKNTHYTVKPDIVVAPKNTVGAGDTLFAYFAAMIIKNNSPLESLTYATSKTVDFLQEKV